MFEPAEQRGHALAFALFSREAMSRSARRASSSIGGKGREPPLARNARWLDARIFESAER
jgi:hypothetical protein